MVSIIDAALAEADAKPSLLQFELRSESLRRHAERLGAIRAAGAAIAVDGFGVTAEGVETPTQADRFRDIGCNTIQGFYVGRPVAAPCVRECLRLLGAHRPEPSYGRTS